ncbi:hypothetical protein DVA81_19680, partial [Acinetobacter baumannii]
IELHHKEEEIVTARYNTKLQITQLQVENKELNVLLNSTLENCILVEKDYRQLSLLYSKSQQVISMKSTESKQLHMLLNS